MFDEPSLGLAPIVVKEIMSLIRNIRNEGATILLVEQKRQTVAESCRSGICA
jgi:branched-chain amino acid transport system ATP-binding protein